MDTRIIKIDPHAVKLLDLNARFMRHEVFQRLVENIQHDGALTQIPFAWLLHDDTTQHPLEPPRYEVLSGNHRVQAACAAGLTEIDLQVTDEYLTPDQRVALQLSHNEIAGEDDPAMLKTLYMQIRDPQFRLYTGFDDKRLQLLSEVKPGSLSEVNLAFQTIALAFLPDEVTEVEAAWEAAKQATRSLKGAWLNRMADYDKALDTLELASASHGIKNTATCLMIVLEVFSRHLDDLAEGWFDAQAGEAYKGAQSVPLSTVLGDDRIPAQAAATIKKALDRLVSRKELESGERWKALEAWAKAALEG